MSDSVIDKYLTKPAGSAASRVEPKDAPASSDNGGSPKMVEFVQKSGDRTAYPYSYLVSVRLLGNATIEVTFTEAIVKLRGRSLRTLYEQLIAQTKRVVEESASGFDDDRQESWVEAIAFEQRG